MSIRPLYCATLGITIALACGYATAQNQNAGDAPPTQALNLATAQWPADTRKAWINAIAAAQTARHLRDAKEAAETGAELARRLTQAGNWSRLNQAREQVFVVEATAQLARAEQTAFAHREHLTRLLDTRGLVNRTPRLQLPAQLPDRLPDLPATVREVGVLLSSEAREAYHQYRSAYALARYYRDDVLPLHQLIDDEMLLRYNGMITSIFEVLADARAHAMAVNASIDAQRDFWLADTDLQNALSTSSPAMESK